MQLIPSDPDVATIVNRIRSGDIDLQPDFQRGEVWSKTKKQRLIDSIMRDWHVPPIHVIENPNTRKQEVLDGQQRLASIRDFVDNQFPVAGSAEPLDPEIQALDGKFYKTLPEQWRRRFNQFTIRLFRIVDYNATEPAELFFRLNQPASLTGAEQRNAFFGRVREQIKALVKFLEKWHIDRQYLGFTNSRMSYDDVLARTALVVQRKTLAEKVTSENLAALYRTEVPLAHETIHLIERAIQTLAVGMKNSSNPPKFNKATLFSWLIFLVRADMTGDVVSTRNLSEFLSFFQQIRNSWAHEAVISRRQLAGVSSAARLFAIYETRSSARVADVSSVLLRDAVIWLAFEDFYRSTQSPKSSKLRLDRLHAAFEPDPRGLEDDLTAKKLIDRGWGKLE